MRVPGNGPKAPKAPLGSLENPTQVFLYGAKPVIYTDHPRSVFLPEGFRHFKKKYCHPSGA